jgi:hypothetical protein
MARHDEESWTDEQVKTLLRLHDARASRQTIVETLGRSHAALISKLSKLLRERT